MLVRAILIVLAEISACEAATREQSVFSLMMNRFADKVRILIFLTSRIDDGFRTSFMINFIFLPAAVPDLKAFFIIMRSPSSSRLKEHSASGSMFEGESKTSLHY